jgi:hypothetical protein
MWQVSSEVHRVLARAGTDLDDPRSAGEHLSQHGEDRRLVALAGLGERQQRLQLESLRVAILEG